MARIRQLKIGFFENEDLAALPPHDRLLFAGLWLLADRAGRLEDRPKRLRAQLFPYEDIDVDAALGRLAAGGFVDRYVVATARYLQIVNFSRHQHLHPNEQKSLIPQRDVRKHAASEHHVSQVEPGNVPAEPGNFLAEPGNATTEPGNLLQVLLLGSTSGKRDQGENRDRGVERIVPQVSVDRARAREDDDGGVWVIPKGPPNPHANPANLINGAELRTHGTHAWCFPGRPNLCVLHTQHQEHIGASQQSSQWLKTTYYPQKITKYPPGVPIGDNRLKFWDKEIAADFPTTPGQTQTKGNRTMAAARRVAAEIISGSFR